MPQNNKSGEGETNEFIAEDGINLDNPLVKLLRKTVLKQEAEENNSNIYCPQCNTNLPERFPFFGWDNEKGMPSYYCTLCEYGFNKIVSEN